MAGFVLGSTSGNLELRSTLVRVSERGPVLDVTLVAERLEPDAFDGVEPDFTATFRRRIGQTELVAFMDAVGEVVTGLGDGLACELGVEQDLVWIELEATTLPGSFGCSVRLGGTSGDTTADWTTDLTCLDRLHADLEALVKELRSASRS